MSDQKCAACGITYMHNSVCPGRLGGHTPVATAPVPDAVKNRAMEAADSFNGVTDLPPTTSKCIESSPVPDAKCIKHGNDKVTCPECERNRTTDYSHHADQEEELPVPDSGTEWLDAPTNDGWWWRCDRFVPPTPTFVDVGVYETACGARYKVSEQLYMKWLFITPPAQPKPKLPATRQVELSAKVRKQPAGDGWMAETFLDGAEGAYDVVETKQDAVELIRDDWGIEPEVSE